MDLTQLSGRPGNLAVHKVMNAKNFKAFEHEVFSFKLQSSRLIAHSH